ncbi:hypothetical protein PF005_g11273 [Phytophthora fragariae]|uniref:Uncharacterized protein n=2 Tax=Phytophthora TaxID=4783 RepID=A0A6A3U0B7_9STRA|nr:hypothetical protein PF003_g13898 [Phytophthora fragariae]KAE9008009.1 hypothetical protein PR001_g16818 [Phytophthora rubi]KAE8937615.1 hypothetical protein PF009_g12484 [Phytophthora fragariae]KAE9009758.1 hypothetical protein PF011_g10122 [Phytophthora fragariae]KAE9082460.1 hypothetical protein PF010_g21574 [Phytophthora fragariae]
MEMPSSSSPTTSQVMSPNPTTTPTSSASEASSEVASMTEAASLLTSPTLVQRPFPTVPDYTGGSQAAYWGQSRATSASKPRSLTYGEAPNNAPGPGRVSASDLAALNDSSTPKIKAITKFDVGKKLSQPSEYPA